jgi:ATP-dependent helicase/nuclease subunit A
VDEFQDTSDRQTALIRLLTEGWSPGDGHTLFCVGDPMQSIYRFREADVGLFLSATEHGLGDLPLESLKLSANFRSAAGVVEWVNSTFSRILPADDDAILGKVGYTASVAAKPSDPLEPVSWIALPGAGAGGLAQRIADEIAGLRASHPDDRIAVLVQKRSQLTALLPALVARDLRFRGIDLLRLDERPAVLDLLSLYRALTHPGDRVAWLALLRGPLCGLELAELESLIGRDPAPLPQQLRDPDRLARLSEPAQARLSRLLDALDQVRPLQRWAPARRWLEAAWLQAGGATAQPDAAAAADAEVLLDLIDALAAGDEVGSADELEEALAALYAPPDPEGDEQLQVMTIHAAKGLEFDQVILMLPHTAGRGDGASLLNYAELRGAGAGPDLDPDLDPVVLAPIGAYGDEADPVHACLGLLGRERTTYETGRLLYVAATRAKRRLVLAGTTAVRGEGGERKLQRPDSGSLLRTLWDHAGPLFEAALENASPAAAATTDGPQQLRRLRADWQPLPAPAAEFEIAVQPVRRGAEIEFSWAGQTARHVGTLVHRLLQRIAEDGLAGWDPARLTAQHPAMRLQLTTLGVPEDAAEVAVRRASDAVAAALSCERGRWLLTAHEDAHCEYALSGIDEGTVVDVVLDRCFVDGDGARWIVDYKTGVHEGGERDAFFASERERYAPQLARYARLFSAMEQRPIRTALYYPHMGELVEVET